MSDFSIDYELNNGHVVIEYDYLEAQENTRYEPGNDTEVWINRILFKDVDILDIVSDRDFAAIERFIVKYLESDPRDEYYS